MSCLYIFHYLDDCGDASEDNQLHAKVEELGGEDSPDKEVVAEQGGHQAEHCQLQTKGDREGLKEGGCKCDRG